jgi:hypothetical protein
MVLRPDGSALTAGGGALTYSRPQASVARQAMGIAKPVPVNQKGKMRHTGNPMPRFRVPAVVGSVRFADRGIAPLFRLHRAFGVAPFRVPVEMQTFLIDRAGILRFHLIHDFAVRTMTALRDVILLSQAQGPGAPAVTGLITSRTPNKAGNRPRPSSDSGVHSGAHMSCVLIYFFHFNGG